MAESDDAKHSALGLKPHNTSGKRKAATAASDNIKQAYAKKSRLTKTTEDNEAQVQLVVKATAPAKKTPTARKRSESVGSAASTNTSIDTGGGRGSAKTLRKPSKPKAVPLPASNAFTPKLCADDYHSVIARLHLRAFAVRFYTALNPVVKETKRGRKKKVSTVTARDMLNREIPTWLRHLCSEIFYVWQDDNHPREFLRALFNVISHECDRKQTAASELLTLEYFFDRQSSSSKLLFKELLHHFDSALKKPEVSWKCWKVAETLLAQEGYLSTEITLTVNSPGKPESEQEDEDGDIQMSHELLDHVFDDTEEDIDELASEILAPLDRKEFSDLLTIKHASQPKCNQDYTPDVKIKILEAVVHLLVDKSQQVADVLTGHSKERTEAKSALAKEKKAFNELQTKMKKEKPGTLGTARERAAWQDNMDRIVSDHENALADLYGQLYFPLARFECFEIYGQEYFVPNPLANLSFPTNAMDEEDATEALISSWAVLAYGITLKKDKALGSDDASKTKSWCYFSTEEEIDQLKRWLEHESKQRQYIRKMTNYQDGLKEGGEKIDDEVQPVSDAIAKQQEEEEKKARHFTEISGALANYLKVQSQRAEASSSEEEDEDGNNTEVADGNESDSSQSSNDSGSSLPAQHEPCDEDDDEFDELE